METNNILAANILAAIRQRMRHAKQLGAKDIWLGFDEVEGLLQLIATLKEELIDCGRQPR